MIKIDINYFNKTFCSTLLSDKYHLIHQDKPFKKITINDKFIIIIHENDDIRYTFPLANSVIEEHSMK